MSSEGVIMSNVSRETMNVYRCSGTRCANLEHTTETCYQRYLMMDEEAVLTYFEWMEAVQWNGLGPDE